MTISQQYAQQLWQRLAGSDEKSNEAVCDIDDIWQKASELKQLDAIQLHERMDGPNYVTNLRLAELMNIYNALTPKQQDLLVNRARNMQRFNELQQSKGDGPQ